MTNLLTTERIWEFQRAHSPSIHAGIERQVLKATEELGELSRAILKHDGENVREELADLINVLYGLSVVIYRNPVEMDMAIQNAFKKMQAKYPMRDERGFLDF